MFASIDCMHWEWKNCPMAWKGQYKSGKEKYPTVVLEAIASYNLWIWHAFFGMPGSCNDITIVEQSPFITRLIQNKCPSINWILNGTEYQCFYLLADGIYPKVLSCLFVCLFYVYNHYDFSLFVCRYQPCFICTLHNSGLFLLKQ